MLRLHHIKYIIIFLSFILLHPSLATSKVAAVLTYNIGLNGLESVEVSVNEPGSKKAANLTTFVVPIRINEIPIGNNEVLGYKYRSGYSIVTIRHPSPGETIKLKIHIDKNTANNAAAITKFAIGAAIVSPLPDPKIFSEINHFSNIANIHVLKNFKSVKAYFPKDYTILEGNREVKIKKATFFDLNWVKNRQSFEIMFLQPKRANGQIVEVIFSRAVVVVLALLLSIMAPGFIPEQYYIKIVFSLIGVLVLFLGVRWYFAVKAKDSLTSVVSDTAASVLYIIVLLIVSFVRRTEVSHKSLMLPCEAEYPQEN